MLVLFLLVFLHIALATQAASGPTCFKCDDVTDHGPCSTVVTCQSDEVCFAERLADSSSQSSYYYGCQKRQVCQAIDSGSGVLGRREMRRDGVETFILACMQCCYTDRCNLRLCQQHSASVPSKPTVVVMPTSTEALQGLNQDVVFSCSFTGIPTPQVFWFYRGSDGKVHDLHTGFITVGASSNLTIKDPKVSDSGTYICTAINNQGTEEASATLTVHSSAPSRPTVVVQPRSTEVVQGRNQDVVFSCSFSGVPTPQIVWFYKGSAGKPDVLHGGYTTLGASSNLTIKDPKVSDSGTYICTAINKQGVENASATLTVHALNSPHLTLSRDEVVDGSPDPLHIYCDSNGSTNVTYSWWFSPRNETWQELNSTSDTLTFDPPTTSIDGHFKCEITNAAGLTSTFINVNVDVLDAPEIHVQPNETIREGEVSTVSLNCQSRGNHPDWMTWSTGSTTLEVRHDSGIVYVIHNPRFIDTADYTCTVSKDNVTKTASVHLAVYALEPPQVTASGKTLPITLTCNASGTTSPHITWYEVTGGMRKEVTSGVRLLQPFLSTLNIPTPDPHQQPQYECHVTNPVGTEITVFNVTIYEKPYFLNDTWEQSLTVSPGQNVTLQCEGRGVPIPSIQWGFMDSNGFPETPGSRGGKFTESPDHFLFTIVNAIEQMNGIYSCKLWNEVGQVTRSVDITVIP